MDLLDLHLDQLLVDVRLVFLRWRLELRRIVPERRRILEAGQLCHLLQRRGQLLHIGQRVLWTHGLDRLFLHIAQLAQHHHPLCVGTAAQRHVDRYVHLGVPDAWIDRHKLVCKANHAWAVLMFDDQLQNKLIQALHACFGKYPRDHLDMRLRGAHSGCYSRCGG